NVFQRRIVLLRAYGCARFSFVGRWQIIYAGGVVTHRLRHLLDFREDLWDSGPMTRAIGVALFALVGLAGCTKTVSEMSFSEREALAKQIEQRCMNQGTVPGTQRHGQCLRVEAEREVVSRE